MTLEEIYEDWEKDSRIDSTDLGGESLNIPRLHHKWNRRFSEERNKLTRYEAALRALKHRKLQFYLYGPDDESRAAGWVLPPRGKILKTEVTPWVENDKDVVELGVRVAEQAEIVSSIERIVRSINGRNYEIKNTIDWLRFTSGG